MSYLSADLGPYFVRFPCSSFAILLKTYTVCFTDRGEMPADQRAAALKRLSEDPDCTVCLMTVQTGSVGQWKLMRV